MKQPFNDINDRDMKEVLGNSTLSRELLPEKITDFQIRDPEGNLLWKGDDPSEFSLEEIEELFTPKKNRLKLDLELVMNGYRSASKLKNT